MTKTYPDIQRSGGDVATTIRILPPKSAVARSRNLLPVEHISPCYECFDSLRSLSISFSPQLKTCHQARQTYEINLLESCESVSVRTSYFKAIVSRHALARLPITRQLDTRYTNTTWSRRPEDYISLEHATNNKVSETSHVSHQLLWHPSLASTDQVSLTVVYLAGNHSQSRTGWKGCWPIQITGRTFQVRASIACREVFTNHRQTGKHSPNRTTQRLRKVVPRGKTEIPK